MHHLDALSVFFLVVERVAKDSLSFNFFLEILKNTTLPRVVLPFRAVHNQCLISEGILNPGPLISSSEKL